MSGYGAVKSVWKQSEKKNQDRMNLKRDRTQKIHVKTSLLCSVGMEWCDSNVLFYIWSIFNRKKEIATTIANTQQQ